MTNTLNTKLEETLHHRRPTVEVTVTDENGSILEYTVGGNDKNNPEIKTIDDSDCKNGNWKTCDYSSLRKWQPSNCYILRGYRPPLPSMQVCLLSIFRIHTETVNIWSHLLGCVVFIALFLHASLSSLPLEDKLVLSPFFVGAIICLAFSSTFHTMHCHSQTFSWFVIRLDYCGIILLITGSYIPWLHYAFFCHIQWKLFYMMGVFTLAICSIVVSLSQTFNNPLYRTLRASVFGSFALSGIVPSIHLIQIHGSDSYLTLAPPLIVTEALYMIGAIIYAVRVPERIFPGKCDIFFQSHQVLHVLVLLATLIDYVGILRLGAMVQCGRNDPDFCQKTNIYLNKPRDMFHNF